MTDHLLRIDEAAEYLGVNVQTLRLWKRTGRGPRYVKIARRLVYPIAEIEAWIARSMVDPAERNGNAA